MILNLFIESRLEQVQLIEYAKINSLNLVYDTPKDSFFIKLTKDSIPKLCFANVEVDSSFFSDRLKFRIVQEGKNYLFKAVEGTKKQKHLKILDLTTGLAFESLMLSSRGHKVKSYERNDLIYKYNKFCYWLVKNNSEHWSYSYLNNLELFLGDATEMESIKDEFFDIVYFDPMYEEHHKTALPSKELQILRKINAFDSDEEIVFNRAYQLKFKKLIVKRPVKTGPILGKKPSNSIKGKKTRYDIYCR